MRTLGIDPLNEHACKSPPTMRYGEPSVRSMPVDVVDVHAVVAGRRVTLLNNLLAAVASLNFGEHARQPSAVHSLFPTWHSTASHEILRAPSRQALLTVIGSTTGGVRRIVIPDKKCQIGF